MTTRLLPNVLIGILTLGLLGCGSDSTPTNDAPSVAPVQMEGLPLEKLEAVYNSAEFADYIFYEPSFSMNQDEPGSVRQVLATIASAPATTYPACKPKGRVFFQVNGVDVLVADIYLGDPCNYYVFIEDDKPAYANLMTPQGIQYFTNNINQVLEMQRQAQPGQ